MMIINLSEELKNCLRGGGDYYVTLCNGGGYVQCVKSVLLYTDEKIVFLSKSGIRITVSGVGLHITKVIDGDAAFCGTVCSAEVDKV